MSVSARCMQNLRETNETGTGTALHPGKEEPERSLHYHCTTGGGVDSQARVQEFVRGGAQNLKAFFFFFCFSISRGGQAPWAPPPGHAPDSPTLPCLAPLRSVDSLLKMANNTALRRGDCRNSSLGDHSFALSASVRLYNN